MKIIIKVFLLKNWLKNNCYTTKNKKKLISPYKLWDSSMQKNLDNLVIDHDEVMKSDESLQELVRNATFVWNSYYKK